MIKENANMILNNIFPYRKLRPMFRHMLANYPYSDLCGIEIGVRYGTNMKSICNYLPIKRLYGVDLTFSKLRYFNKKQCDYIQLDSLTASKYFMDNAFDFVYLDGSHKYDTVVREIVAYLPKVKKYGYLGGHDFNNKEVSKAVFDTLNYNDINDGEDWFIIKK